MNMRPMRLITSTLLIPRRYERRAAAGRALGVVRGTDEPGLTRDEDQRLALVESVVAERDRVGAGGQKILADRLGNAEAAGGVLAIDDDEIEPPMLASCGRRASSAARPLRPTTSPTKRSRISPNPSLR